MLIIRENQMQAFSEAMHRSFETRMVKHLRQTFPDKTASMMGEKKDDQPIREWIRQGIKAASRYGIEAERDVARFIELTVQFGQGFEKTKDMQWAGRILVDPKLSGHGKVELIRQRLGQEDPA